MKLVKVFSFSFVFLPFKLTLNLKTVVKEQFTGPSQKGEKLDKIIEWMSIG